MLDANEITPFLVHSIRASDFDQFNEAVAPWDFHIKNLEKAPLFKCDSKMLLSEGLVMTYANFGNILHQTGTTPRGMKTFLVPMDPYQHFFSRNQEIKHTDIGFYNHGEEIDTISKVGFKTCVISIAEQTLANRASIMGIDWLSVISSSNKECYTLGKGALNKLRGLILQLYALGENVTMSERKTMAFTELKDWIIDFFILGCFEMHSCAKPELSNRARVFKRFNDYINSNISSPYSSAELCAYTGASERTLQYAIKYFTQLTPINYAKAIKLNLIRDNLLVSDTKSTKIKQLAFEHGFWHNTQFASDYRIHFGELPSETLKG